jgi:hypothetical protein
LRASSAMRHAPSADILMMAGRQHDDRGGAYPTPFRWLHHSVFPNTIVASSVD